MVVSDAPPIRPRVARHGLQLDVFGGRKEMESLKKELEEELKLSTEDLRSHAWYHGSLSREVRRSPSLALPLVSVRPGVFAAHGGGAAVALQC